MCASEVAHSFFLALIDLLIVPPGLLTAGWAIPILTDTACAVALIALLGGRVPVERRVFLSAIVIIDDLVAIVVIALFHPAEIDRGYLVFGIAVTGLLAALNKLGRVPQLSGAGTHAGIGFTMSLFIAGVAFPDLMDSTAARVGIFLASLLAGGLGILILLPKELRIDLPADSAINGDDVKGQ